MFVHMSINIIRLSKVNLFIITHHHLIIVSACLYVQNTESYVYI